MKFGDSLVLSGSTDNPIVTEKDWTISMTFEVYSVANDTAQKTDTDSFDWKFKNPCVDEDFTKVI